MAEDMPLEQCGRKTGRSSVATPCLAACRVEIFGLCKLLRSDAGAEKKGRGDKIMRCGRSLRSISAGRFVDLTNPDSNLKRLRSEDKKMEAEAQAGAVEASH